MLNINQLSQTLYCKFVLMSSYEY